MNEVLKPLSANQDNVLSLEKKLIHFGADYIIFNLAALTSANIPKSISYLDSLFNLSHNDSNSNEYEVTWKETDTDVVLQFQPITQKGEIIKVNSRGKALMQIVKINPKWAKNIGYRYQYAIDCSGTFFDFARLGLINPQQMLAPFLADVEANVVRHSVSRIDICADLSGYTVKSILRGINGSKEHMKKITVFNTANPETFYYGYKQDKWHARGYNKLLDIQKKGKGWIFLPLGYLDYQTVTRLEVEAHSDVCLNNSLTLPLCLNTEYLYGIYKSLLSTKFVKFQIIPFIEKSLIEQDFHLITLLKREHHPHALTELQKFKRLFSQMDNVCVSCGISYEELFNLYKYRSETGMSSNQEALATDDVFRTMYPSIKTWFHYVDLLATPEDIREIFPCKNP